MAGFDFTELLILFTILIASLTFHEAAHAWAATLLGDPTARLLGRLSLNPAVHIDPIGTIVFPLIAMMTGVPLLGWAKPVPVDMRNLRHPRRDFAVVALAGPVSNVILAIVIAVLINVLVGAGMDLRDAVGRALFQAVLLNVVLAVFNMVPIPPLDGGNVLIGLLPGPLADMVEKLRPWGFLLIYALLLTGVLSAVMRPVYYAVTRWLL